MWAHRGPAHLNPFEPVGWPSPACERLSLWDRLGHLFLLVDRPDPAELSKKEG